MLLQALKQSQITSWMQQPRWSELRACVCKLMTVLDNHCTYLQKKCKSVKLRHDSVVPDTDSGTVCVVPTNTSVSCRIAPLDNIIREKPFYERVGVNEFCSVDPKKKYQHVQNLKKGFTIPCILYIASLGSNLSNHLFLWKIPHGVTLEAATTENGRIIDNIKRALPTYHSRAMRREFINRFGLVSGRVKSHVLRKIYQELTGLCKCVYERNLCSCFFFKIGDNSAGI